MSYYEAFSRRAPPKDVHTDERIRTIEQLMAQNPLTNESLWLLTIGAVGLENKKGYVETDEIRAIVDTIERLSSLGHAVSVGEAVREARVGSLQGDTLLNATTFQYDHELGWNERLSAANAALQRGERNSVSLNHPDHIRPSSVADYELERLRRTHRIGGISFYRLGEEGQRIGYEVTGHRQTKFEKAANGAIFSSIILVPLLVLGDNSSTMGWEVSEQTREFYDRNVLPHLRSGELIKAGIENTAYRHGKPPMIVARKN